MTTRTVINIENVQVGDILVDVWGYSMVLVGFWQVIGKTAKQVTVREIEQTETGTGFLSGVTVPKAGQFRKTQYEEQNKAHKAQVAKSGHYLVSSLYFDEPHFLEPWDGRQVSFNHCD